MPTRLWRCRRVTNTRKFAIPSRPYSVAAFTKADSFLHFVRVNPGIKLHPIHLPRLASKARDQAVRLEPLRPNCHGQFSNGQVHQCLIDKVCQNHYGIIH
jgi:hypothetical protein